jgi:hypothetical protein
MRESLAAIRAFVCGSETSSPNSIENDDLRGCRPIAAPLATFDDERRCDAVCETLRRVRAGAARHLTENAYDRRAADGHEPGEERVGFACAAWAVCRQSVGPGRSLPTAKLRCRRTETRCMNTPRRSALAALALSMALTPGIARAAPATEPHGFDFIASPTAVAIASAAGVEVSLAAFWRPVATVAVGLLGAATWPPTSVHTSLGPDRFEFDSRHLCRVTPAVRWDFHSNGSTRAWVGADAGALFVVVNGKYYPADGSSSPMPRSTTTSAPVIGGNAGFAIHALRSLSFGLQVGVWNAFSPVPSDVAIAGSVGLVIGVHVPLAQSDRSR